MDKGWIRLHRKVRDCWLWDEKPFDRARAWVELLLVANHKDKKTSIGGTPIVIQRGQYLTSILKLSDRFGWSRNKTKRFLAVLEAEDMITTERTNQWTIVTIVNYGIYNDKDDDDEPTEGHQKDTEKTSEEQRKDNGRTTTKELKNDKNDEECKECKESNKLDSKESNRPTSQSDEAHSDIRKLWNTLSEYGVKPIKKIVPGTQRDTFLKARLRQYGRESFDECIENIKHSEFLKHKLNKTGITFDWLIRPNNYPKVLEGNYNDGKISAKDEWGGLV